MPRLRERLRRTRRRLGFHLLRCLALVCSVIGGLPLARRCGEWLGELHYRFGWRKRRDLLRQQQRLFPATDLATLQAGLRQAYRTGDRAVFEAIAMGCRPVPREVMRASLEIDGLARLKSALHEGRGVILLGMHMGNGILLAARLAAEGLPVSLVYRSSRKIPGSFLQHCLNSHGIAPISSGKRSRAYREMLRALQRGGIVLVLMDQATRHGGLPVEFLGKTLEFPAGPPRLALSTGAQVLPAFAQSGAPHWRFTVGEPLALGSSVPEALLALAGAMESHIRLHPELWTWQHRRWRRYPFVDTRH